MRKRTKEEYEALDKVNAYWKRFNATHNRLAKAVETGADIDEVTVLARREESRATKFLNSLHNLFGMSVPLDRIVGNGNPVTAGLVGARDPKIAQADERRIRQTQALFADTTAGKGASEEELLALRLNNYAKAIVDTTAATKAKEAAEKRLTAAVQREAVASKEHEAALDEASRAALRSAENDLEIARIDREALPAKGGRKPLTTDEILAKLDAKDNRDENGVLKDPRLRNTKGEDLYEAVSYKEALSGKMVRGVQEPELRRRIGPQEQDYRKSAQDQIDEESAQRRKEISAREVDARSRVTALLGAESESLKKVRQKRDELARALAVAKKVSDAEAQNIKNLAVAKARGKVESTESALREKERLGANFGITDGELAARAGIPVPFVGANGIQVAPQGKRNLAGVSDEDLAAARLKAKEARDALVAIERIDPADLVRELKDALDATAAEVNEASAKGKGTGRASGTVDNSAEIKAISDRRQAAIALGKQYTAANLELKAAKEAKDKAGIAAAQEKKRQIKADPAYLGVNERNAMGRQLKDLRAGGDGTGDGSGGSGGKGAAAGGGPDGGGSSILRQILAAIKEVNVSIKSGLKISAGKVAIDEKGNVTVAPKTRAPRVDDPENPRRAPGETREMALVRTKQQLQLAEIRAGERTEKVNKRLEQQAQRQAQVDTEAAHAKLRLSDAMDKLNQTAKAELRQLDLLRKAGGTAAEVAAQEARTIAAVERSVKQSNPTSTSADRQRTGRAVTGLDRNQYDSARASAKAIYGESFATSMGELGDDSRNLLAKRLFGDNGFWSRIAGSTGAFIVRNFTAGFVFGLTNALQDIVMQGIQTEATFIRVSDALEQTGRSVGSLRSDLQGISSSYGVALNDVYMTAAGLAGVFDDVGDLASATKVVAELQQISMGALNAQEAMGVLASITGAYRDELRGGADGLSQVADVLTVVQNVIGANVETTAEGVGALSGLAQQLKIPFEEMSVYVAQIAKLTNQTGAAAGEQFSRILASFQSGRGRGALAEALPDSGIEQLIGSGEYGQAIQVLMREWDGLSESQQRNLATTIAGQRQARAFAALMSDTGKTLEATARAHNANGEAQARAERIAATLNGRLQRLQANLQNLAQNLIRTGILDFFGLFLVVANGALVVVNKFLSALNDITDSNPFLNALKRWGAGLLGFIATLKLAQVAYRGFRASIQGEGAASRVAEAVVNGGGGTTLVPGTTKGKSLRTSIRDVGPGLAGSFSRNAARLETKAADQALARGIQSTYVASPAVRDAAVATKAHSAALKASAVASRGASAASKGLGTVLGGVAGLGLGAGAALTGAVVAFGLLTDELGRQKEMQEQLLELNKRYDPLSGAQQTPEEQKLEYVGPYSEISMKNAKETKGFWARVKFDMADTYDQLKQNPFSKEAFTGITPGAYKARVDAWRGVIDDELQGQLDALRKTTEDAINGVDGGAATVAEGGDLGALLFQDPALKNQVEGKKFSIKDVEQAGGTAGRALDKMRADLIKEYDDGDGKMTEGKFAAAMAAIEEAAVSVNERIARQMAMARGLLETDILSPEMIKQIDQLRPLFQGLQGVGGLDSKVFGEGLRTLIDDTGVSKGGETATLIEQLGRGGMTKVDAMRTDALLIKKEYDNIQSKYQAALATDSGVDPEQVDEYRDQMIAKMAELAATTENIIQAAIQQATTIADAAVASGNFGAAAQAVDLAIATIRAERGKFGPESPDVKAMNDLRLSQAYERKATDRSTGQNGPLQLQAAESQNALVDAQLEAQQQRNVFLALRDQRDAAQKVGETGPSVAALRAAKISWVTAEQSLSQLALQADISALALQAAGMWNGTALAQNSEAQALLQLNYAIENSGIGSPGAHGSADRLHERPAQHPDHAGPGGCGDQRRGAGGHPSGQRRGGGPAGREERAGGSGGGREVRPQLGGVPGRFAQLYSAQQQVSSATSAVASAQVGVAIAIADAAGNTVKSAQLQLVAARIAALYGAEELGRRHERGGSPGEGRRDLRDGRRA